MSKTKMEVQGAPVTVISGSDDDYISLTDIARYKNTEHSDDLFRNWLRNRSTLEFDGIWERLNNPAFNSVVFGGIRKQAVLNSFTLTHRQWISLTNAIGVTSNAGRDDGTHAHRECLSNLETLNAHLLQQGLEQSERLRLLSQTAIEQMSLLLAGRGVQQLQRKSVP